MVLLVLLGLVVGLGAGLVALAGSWLRAPDPVAAPVCRAEVADPDGGDPLRAELSPERTANAALVVGLAHRRGLPARAATIGIATAIQESGLVNIDYGDRDSLGLFQQRPSQGWGTPEQVQDPVYATTAFYDALVEVDGYAGLEITDAAQRVQRSGFPEAYADHEAEGRALASSLYGLSPASLVCRLPPVDRTGSGSDSGNGNGNDSGSSTVPGTPQDSAAAVVSELDTWAAGGWTASPVTSISAGTEGNEGNEGETEDGPQDAVVVLDASAAAEPARTAWALAHSAVALAQAHGVVRVEVAGQVWDRAEPDLGWHPVATPSGTPGQDGPGDGLVRVVTG